MNLWGKHPAVVRSWNRATRECRVEIPGVTDGADVFPIAELAYPIGDKSEHTEIRVIVGDRVWVEFERGDPRFPIITAWRTKRVGNEVGTRRWHHDNFQLDADQEYTLNAGTKITLHVGNSTIVATDSGVTVTTSGVTLEAPSTVITGNVSIQGNLAVAGGEGGSGVSSISGNFNIVGSISCNGKNIGDTHTHPDTTSGGNTGPVN